MSGTPAPATVRTWDKLTVPTPGVFVLDPAHTEIGFVARHLMVTKVRGHFGQVEGSITIAENPLESSGEATMQGASLTTGNEQRDTHLTSTDFLKLDEFPKITFRSTSVKGHHGTEFTVVGDLSINGITRPVQLAVDFDGVETNPFTKQQVIAVSASGEIDREEFGMTWNVALESGGVLVSKKIKIEIEAEAIRRD